MNTRQYFRLELKRAMNILPRFLGSIFVIGIVCIGSIIGVSYAMKQSKIIQPVKIGLVVSDNDAEMKLISRFLPAMESVKNLFEFVSLTKDEAIEQVENEEIQAAILLPEHFFTDIIEGENTPAKIILGDNENLSIQMFEELIKAGVSMLRTSEAALYAISDAAYEYDITMSQGDMEYFISYLYLNTVLGRERLYQNIMLSDHGEINSVAYDSIVCIIVILLFSGINFQYLFRPRERALESKLKSYGVGPMKIIGTKVIVMSMVLWLLSLSLYLLVTTIKRVFHIPIPLPRVWLLLFIIPLLISFATFFAFIYTLTRRNNQSGLILILIQIIMLIGSGFIIPIQLLPKLMQKVELLLPMRYWSDYIIQAWTGHNMVWSLFIVSVVSLLYYGGAVLGLCKNT